MLTEISNVPDYQGYISIFNNRREKLVCDKTTLYLYSKVAARKIYEFNPHAKIIIMLRNPVDACFSKYLFSYYSGYEWLPFEEAIQVEPIRKQRKMIRIVRFVDFYLYISIYKYYEQVKRYIEKFPSENIKIIKFEEFMSNTTKKIREVLEFLGVDIKKFDFSVCEKIYNYSRMPRNFLWHEFRYFLFLVLPYYRQKFSNLPAIYYPIRAMQFSLFGFFLLSRKFFEMNYKPKMSDETREKLKNIFKEDIEKLSELIKVDLTDWIK